MPFDPGFNQCYLVGVIAKAPEYVYMYHGFRTYEGVINVVRLSGEIDRLPFVVKEEIALRMRAGDRVELIGTVQHRDRHMFPNVENRLVVNVGECNKVPVSKSAENVVVLSGNICRTPVLRETPRGRIICEITLAVPKGYGPQEYIFCIAWNALALSLSEQAIGAPIQISGRFQSRAYQKCLPDGSTQNRTALEISISSVS